MIHASFSIQITQRVSHNLGAIGTKQESTCYETGWVESVAYLHGLEENMEIRDLFEDPYQTLTSCCYFKLISIFHDLKNSFEQGCPAAPLAESLEACSNGKSVQPSSIRRSHLCNR